MNEVIIVSLCEKYINKMGKVGYEFHFKGHYLGMKINKINVFTNFHLSPGGEYILLLKTESVLKSTLLAQLIRFKRLRY